MITLLKQDRPKKPRSSEGLLFSASMLNKLKLNGQFFILALPGILFLLLFNYIPLFGMLAAFKNYRFTDNFFVSIINSSWVGFKNFAFLFQGDAFIITRNTILYNLAFIVMGIAFSVTVAIIISELRNKKMGRMYQGILIFPYYVSWVIAAYMFYAFLSPDKGMMNNLLATMGLEGVSWYTEPKYWPFILIFCNLWKKVGYDSVIYLATITGIPTDLYEAAQIDGANKWKQIVHITLPSIKPMIIILTLLAVGRMFYSDFGLFLQIPRQSGPLFPVTNVIDTYVYYSLRNSGNIGMSAAAGVYQSVIGFILVLTANKVVKKIDKDSALF